MGAWGPDTFENDSACDWIAELRGVHDLSAVERTLAGVLDGGPDYLDADAGCDALAACEVIARLRNPGGQQDPYTEDLDAWVKANPQTPSPALVQRALAAIDRVLGDGSELAELWEDDPAWHAAVAGLRGRVA